VPPAAPGEAEELLGDLLRALLDLPSLSNADDPRDSRWGDIAAKLPDELFERLDRWMETRSADAEVGLGRWRRNLFLQVRTALQLRTALSRRH